MSEQIFLAHGTSTAAEAEQLTAELERRGEKVWLDRREQKAGEKWKERNEEALGESKAYVILVRFDGDPSEHLRAEWTRAVWQSAIKPEKKIVPVVVGGQQPPPFLRLWNAVEMTEDMQATSERVLHALKAPGFNEAPADSPTLKPVVDIWRRNLEEIERSALSMSAEPLEAENVE